MIPKQKEMSETGAIILFLVLLNIVILKIAFIKHENWYWILLITLPSLYATNYFLKARKQSKLKNDNQQHKKVLQQNFFHLN